jgi:putative SOS response-associated peptidase YedK
MCGRYYRRSDKQRIAEAYRLGEIPFDLVLPDWDFNVAPTTFQPVVRQSRDSRERELVLMRWGLVPYFTEQLSDVKGISTINARAEGIERSPTWRVPFLRRRCLVPADGFYEWVRPASRSDDCPAWPHDRTCRPIGSTLGGQAVR